MAMLSLFCQVFLVKVFMNSLVGCVELLNNSLCMSLLGAGFFQFSQATDGLLRMTWWLVDTSSPKG